MSHLETLKTVLECESLPEELRQRVEQEVQFQGRVVADEGAFQHLGSRLDCGLLVVDERGVVTYLNDRLGEIFRAPRSALVGQFVAAWLSEEDKPLFFRQFSMRRNKGSSDPYRLRCHRADHSQVCVSIVPFPRFDEHGTFRGTFAMIFEVASDGAADATADLGKAKDPAEPPPTALDGLSQREREIVDMLLAGREVAEVAEACSISQHTVRNHIKAIYRKLGVHSRADLVRRVVGH